MSLRFAGERRQLACGVREPAEDNFRRQVADECRLAARRSPEFTHLLRDPNVALALQSG